MNTNASRPWTDEEYGFVHDSDLPAKRIAEHLGRSVHSVKHARAKLRSGWVPARAGQRAWSEEEDRVVMSMQHMTATDTVALLDGRTQAAIARRRHALRKGGASIPDFTRNSSPFRPGARTLLAKTCQSCGLVLARKFYAMPRSKDCNKCLHTKRGSSGRSDEARRKTKATVAIWQNMTLEAAENHRKPWLESDMTTLSDPSLTLLEKALALKRTYLGTAQAAIKNGFKSKYGAGDPEREQWLIDNPNMDRLESIAEQVAAMHPAASMPEDVRELVSVGGRPNFEWDD